MFLLSQFKLYAYAAAAVALLIFIGVIEYKVYHAGYDKADAYYKAQIAAETARELEVQDKVLSKQTEIINSLNASNAELDKKLKEINDEAAKDPNAGKCGLRSSAVVRIDRVH